LFETDDTYQQFLLEADALLAMAASEQKDAAPDHVTGYIGSKRKLVDWIWQHTPDGVGSVLDAFRGSSIVAYMFKKQGLRVVANDRLRFSWHVARAIIENVPPISGNVCYRYPVPPGDNYFRIGLKVVTDDSFMATYSARCDGCLKPGTADPSADS